MKKMMKKERFFNMCQQTVGAVERERERERERDVIFKPREKECGKRSGCGNLCTCAQANNRAKSSTVQIKSKKIMSRLLVATLLILAMSFTTVFASSQTSLDTTPPEITEFLSEENGTEAILYGSATDNESNIIGYAFTNMTDEPTTWNTSNSNSIYETYTVNASGTYYFWVKNESGVISNKSIVITVQNEIPKYTVTYNANGGSGAPANQIKTENEALTLSDIVPTRVGHTFLGWADTSGTDTAIYQPSATYTVDGNAVLYAIWLPDRYTITYNLNGAGTPDSIASQTKIYGKNMILSSEVPTKRRYEFIGWATSEANANNNIVSYSAGTNYAENGEATLYAVWDSRLIPSIANAPVLGDGMEAVYWSDEDATAELTSSTFTSDMYNYTMGNGVEDTKQAKWANAKTTDDGSYWVWIPRYAYSLIYYEEEERVHETTSKTKYGDIDILFMYGTSDTHYRDINGTPQPLPEGYKVHPAFQAMTTEEDLTTNPLGKWDTELEGIWVAKYEASREYSDDGENWMAGGGDSNSLTTNAGNTSSTQSRVVAKPSVSSWTWIEPRYIYQNCENMYEELNTHQMKNSEWGAATYLAYSPYGRNGESVSGNRCDRRTGAGPGLDTGYYGYSEDTFYTTYAWNTIQGKLASTTGNIYGIYDMSGGAFEYTASYVNNGSDNLTNYGSNLVDSTKMRNKQVYMVASNDTATENYNLALNIYGDAVCETSITAYACWDNSSSDFPYGNSPFFTHGGAWYNSGIFRFNSYSHTGGYLSVHGFRPVICVTSSN